MKYTLNSINQIGIVDAGLEKKTDVIDWLILDYIFEWKDAPKAQSLNGMVWLSYSHFIKEMPLLGIKDKGAISRRIKKLRELNLIETHQSPDDMRLYAKTTALYYGITKFQATPTPVDLKQHPLTPINTPVDLKQHPVDENQHTTVILNNSNTKEQIKEKTRAVAQVSREKFTEPTLEEVADYISEKKYSVDPESFFAFYKSNGWMVGKNKMKCWKSAMVTWAKRQPQQSYSPKQAKPSRMDLSNIDYREGVNADGSF
ncbi:MAG: hypothetical protein WAW61_22375 [Methylococcaceae bacterium]